MQKFICPKDVKLVVYDECKYSCSDEVFNRAKEINFKFCIGFDVVSGKDAGIKGTDDDVDDYDEYLILYFEDGNVAMYRNSYVDLFSLFNSKR